MKGGFREEGCGGVKEKAIRAFRKRKGEGK